MVNKRVKRVFFCVFR